MSAGAAGSVPSFHLYVSLLNVTILNFSGYLCHFQLCWLSGKSRGCEALRGSWESALAVKPVSWVLRGASRVVSESSYPNRLDEV